MVDVAERMEDDRVLLGYQMTELGALPEGWRVVPLSDVSTLQRGQDLPKEQRVDGKHPVVGSNGVAGHHAAFAVKGPGVLVGRSGSVGKVTWVDDDFWPLNTALWVKDFHGNDRRFVYYLLSSLNLAAYASGVSVPTLNRNVIHPVRVALPPLPEQRAIAHVLSTVQRAREATDAVIAATRELKRSLMCHLLTYGPLPVDRSDGARLRETEFGWVPEHWSVQPLDTVATVQSGLTKGRKLVGRRTVRLPYLRVANVQDGFLDLSEIKHIDIPVEEIERFSLSPGDVLLTEGGDFDKLGRGVLWRGEITPCVHQNHIFAVRAERSMLLPEFLAYYVQSHLGKAYFLQVAHRTTHLASINTTKLKALPVPLPPIRDQYSVVAALNSVDDKLSVEASRSNAFGATFAASLQTLLFGTLRLPTPPTLQMAVNGSDRCDSETPY